MDNRIEKLIEMDRVKECWKLLAVTDHAKNKIDEMSIILSETELRKQLKDTSYAREMIEKCGNPPVQNVSEIREILDLSTRGVCLTPYQLEKVQTVLAAIGRLKDYLSRGKAYDNSLAFYDENLVIGEELGEEIVRQIRGGDVDDHATKELLQLRMQIARCDEQMRQKAEQVIRKNKECMADSFSTVRNGRICVPVKKEYKFRIPGSVIDKSGTGSTLFVEPTEAAKVYEELELLKIGEENEVYSILYTLSAMVAAEAENIAEKLEMIERLDFIFSKGKLSLDMEACEPQINTDRRIRLERARHPLMDKEIAVPLGFEIGGETQGIVITGPNTGGKTVTIKTVMLNSIMAQCGLHVTCEAADICMNSSYLCDIGDGQNLAENLSTFSAHITNVLSVLNSVSRGSFVIMDELGSGTDPTEGMGIAIAILEELRKSGALFLVTTHYPEVKEYAARAEHIINARMTFDRETLRPTYRMVIGEAGESCAFYIAERLGMPNEMLRVAIRAAYGEEAEETYRFQKEDPVPKGERAARKKPNPKIQKTKKTTVSAALTAKYRIGDSVMVYPDKKIGIVCEPINERGVLRVQMPDKKIWINHKRVKLHVAAEELYPEDYDFSILFESVENRKKLHDMSRKYTEEVVVHEP